MNGLGKCMMIPHVAKLRQITRKWRKLASVSKVAQAVVCKVRSLGFSRVSCVSDDQHVGMEKTNGGHRLWGSLFAVPPDVPSGHLPVYVGQQCRTRFVIRVAYLNHPVFRTLLQQAEEEFGYTHQGVLSIPCNELLFELILKLIFSQNDQWPSVGHLDLEEFKVNLCNEWYCLSEAKGIMLVNEMEASPAYAFEEKFFG